MHVQERTYNRFLAEEDEVRVGPPLQSQCRAGDDDLRAEIAAHGVEGDANRLAHRCCSSATLAEERFGSNAVSRLKCGLGRRVRVADNSGGKTHGKPATRQ